MGESMSKRLRLQFGGEAEMEERCFPNPYPDYRPPQPAATGDPEADAATGEEAEELDLPFDRDGKAGTDKLFFELPEQTEARRLLIHMAFHEDNRHIPMSIRLAHSDEIKPASAVEMMQSTLNTLHHLKHKLERIWKWRRHPLDPCMCTSVCPTWLSELTSRFLRRIQAKISDLLQQMEEGLKTADPHDCSTYTGYTGIVLLYLQLYRVTQEQAHLQRSLDYVKRILRNLNGRKVSFLCGDAGPLAVGAVVHHKLQNQAESNDCITKLLQLQKGIISQDSELPDELLYGRAGYLYALLYINTEIGPDTVPPAAIKEVVDAIIESGKNLSKEEHKAERCPLLYQWHKKYYVGAAHGLAGIYYMLMQPLSKVDQETLNELVKPCIDYVRHKKFRSGNYPSSLSNETDRLVHWCHGAPGVIHMLLQAHKVFKEEKYLKDAIECSDVIWQRGLLRKGYGICHGTAGNGYSFLSLYHHTQDKKYLYRACKFAEWCLDYGKHGCRIPDRPYSLFEGMAGALHFLSDMLAPEKSCFPAFEL